MGLTKAARNKIIGASLIVAAAGALIVQRNNLAAQRTELQTKAAQLEAENAQLQRVAQLEALRELPVTVGFRKPLFGTGKTAEIKNLGSVGMAVEAHIVDAASHQARNFTVNIDPGHMAEIGRNQGYTFEPGDQMTLAHDGYKSKYWIVQ